MRDRIADLERFIVKAPELAERAQQAQHDRLNTLPPPDGFLPEVDRFNGGNRSGDFPRLTRAQEAQLRRHRAANLAVFVGVALALAAFALWFAENL